MQDDIKDVISREDSKITNEHNDSLLFRIYDKKNNILMYPEFSELGCTFGESPDGVQYPNDASDFLFDICAWDSTRYIADKSTGLRDATGRLIYENDVFEYHQQKYTVVYIEKAMGFYFLNNETRDLIAFTDININNIII